MVLHQGSREETQEWAVQSEDPMSSTGRSGSPASSKFGGGDMASPQEKEPSSTIKPPRLLVTHIETKKRAEGSKPWNWLCVVTYQKL